MEVLTYLCIFIVHTNNLLMFAWVLKVHITQGDHEGRGVIVSWITPDEEGSTSVLYWAANSQIKKNAGGSVVRYKFHNYSSGYIHHCTINDLEVTLSQILYLHFNLDLFLIVRLLSKIFDKIAV